jgi:hypothetical protein
MSVNNWDDWEDNNFKTPINILTEEQLKRMEERRLIEESDTELAKELFSDTTSHKKINVKNEITKTPEENMNINKKNSKTKKLNNQHYS